MCLKKRSKITKKFITPDDGRIYEVIDEVKGRNEIVQYVLAETFKGHPLRINADSSQIIDIFEHEVIE